MATANARVQFVYVAGSTLPASPDSNTVYFVAGGQALYLGSTLIADHQDLSSFALSTDIPTITVTGSGECVTNAEWNASTKTLTLTKGDLSSTYVAQEAGKGLSTNDFTDALKQQLEDLVETGGEVNQNAYSNMKVGSTTIAASAKTDTFEFAAGSNVTLTPDASNKKITIAATDTTYDPATSSANGLMSSSDKAALDAIVAEVSGKEDHLENVQADWNQTTTTADDYIKNKPTNVSEFTNDAGYLTSATVPEYSITKTSGGTNDAYSARYTLTKDGTAVSGAQTIDIPKDMVVESGTVGTVTTADTPYTGAQVGDKYIDLVLANATSDHVYVPVNDLVDVYTQGTGITISNNQISVDTTTIATRTYAESQALVWQVPS